jgi:thiamine-monophosphate kinase
LTISEQQLIQRISRASQAARPKQATTARVLRGIGDDCAVLDVPSGYESLITTDFSLEGVHFRREWHPADVVGHRCLTRGLSDIAAMGGEPVAAFLSLALPADTPQRWVDQFFEGMLRLAKKHGVTLAGGDTAQSPCGILADVTVLGIVPAGRALLRSGARPHDRIYVTGELGAPAAVLEQMIATPGRKLKPSAYPAHFYPQPQVAVARYLRQNNIASAMIDISDGLSVDLRHICEQSRVGAVIHANAVPVATLDRHEVESRHALHGGDEYQLLFTAPQGHRVPSTIAGVPVTLIGYIDESPDVMIEYESDNGKMDVELKPEGWQHFAPAAPIAKRAKPTRKKASPKKRAKAAKTKAVKSSRGRKR